MNYLLKIFIIQALFSSLIFAFEVVDDGAVVQAKSGSEIIKYYTIYNNDKDVQKIEILPVLAEYPDSQKIPPYQINLVNIGQKSMFLPVNKKTVLPVYINANRRFKKGSYNYWVIFSQKKYQTSKYNVQYQKYKQQKMPLLIELI